MRERAAIAAGFVIALVGTSLVPAATLDYDFYKAIAAWVKGATLAPEKK